MALTGSADFESADAGEDKTVTYTAVGLTGSKAANYELTAFTAETTASITAMPIAFTVGAATFAYDGNPKPVTVTAKDANGALFTDFTVLYDGSGDAPSDAGIYTVTVGEAVGDTITITATKAGDGNHEQKEAYVVFIPVAKTVQFTISNTTQTYDGSAKAVSVSSSVDGATYEVTYNGSAAAPTSAGTYTIYATFSGENYESLTVQDTFTIAKAKLTATAENKTRAYGEANPVFTIAYSGFVSGEDERVLWQAPMATCSAIPTSPAGDYDIVLTGDFAENYDIELVNGKLTVTADTTGTLSIEGGRAKAKVGDSFTVTAAYGGGKFGPEDSITREQMALILYNYAGYKDYDRTGEASLTEYNDNGRVSDWAREAMIWAVSQGLISGTGGSMLDPAGSATRAEAAQSLTNFWQKIVP